MNDNALTQPSNQKPFLESSTPRVLDSEVDGDTQEWICQAVIRGGLCR